MSDAAWESKHPVRGSLVLYVSSADLLTQDELRGGWMTRTLCVHYTHRMKSWMDTINHGVIELLSLLLVLEYFIKFPPTPSHP